MARAQVDSYFFFHCLRVTVALFLGLIAYLSRNTCDDTAPSPVVRNRRGDTAEGQVQSLYMDWNSRH